MKTVYECAGRGSSQASVPSSNQALYANYPSTLCMFSILQHSNVWLSIRRQAKKPTTASGQRDKRKFQPVQGDPFAASGYPQLFYGVTPKRLHHSATSARPASAGPAPCAASTSAHSVEPLVCDFLFKMRFLVVALLCCVVALAAASDSDVLALSSSTFQPAISSNEFVFVKFFAPYEPISALFCVLMRVDGAVTARPWLRITRRSPLSSRSVL